MSPQTKVVLAHTRTKTFCDCLCRAHARYTCVRCTPSGQCAPGEFHNRSACAGDTESDSSCQVCSQIDLQHRFNVVVCRVSVPCLSVHWVSLLFITHKQNHTVCRKACATSCEPGKYYKGLANSCDGTKRYDDSCAHCTRRGQCPPGTFWNETTCAGSDATTDACFDCTQVGLNRRAPP